MPEISREEEIDKVLNARSFRVLIADDEEDARALLGIALDDCGWDLVFCENGDQAIEAFREQAPDLVISDIQMPGRNGIEVCQWIKEHSEGNFIPVILLTCRSELTDKVNGLNCGADDYITKPFALPELEARVRALLRIKVLTNELRETRNLLAQREKELVAMSVAGGAAHELGQPLTSILLNCQLLAKLESGSNEFEQTLKTLKQQCHRMREIVGQLHELTEFRTTDYPGELQIVDLNQAASN